MTDEQKQLAMDYKEAFGTQSGLKVYEDLQKWSRYDARIQPCDVSAGTGFALGRRDMFIHIKEKVEANLDEKRQEMAETEPEDAEES